MKFSGRTQWPRVENALSRLRDAKETSGEKILDLTESNPTRCGFKYLNSKLIQGLSGAQNLIYDPHPRGLLRTRENIARYYESLGVKISPEAVFLTASTSEAYTFLFRLLCDPGDRVLCFNPGYPLFDYLADLNDAKLVRSKTRYGPPWKYDLKDFQALAEAERPKAVLLVHPNNPTGHYAGEEERRGIIEAARALEAAVISDEVFFDYAYPGGLSAPKTFCGEKNVLTFCLGGVSKMFGLPQMKLGWVAVSGPPEDARGAIERLEIIADTFLSVNTPSQHAADDWFGMRREIQKEIMGRVLLNRNSLESLLPRSGRARFLEAEGGWYAVLDLGLGAEEDIALRLLEETNVLVHPGYFYEFEQGSFLIFSLLPEPTRFGEGISRIVSHIG